MQTEQKYPMEYNSEVQAATAELYKRVSKIIPEVEWPFHAPLIHEILKLKKEKNIAILTHNYQTPEIFHCVSDIVGDSLKLAYEARDSKADTIILCGVHFMAETAKILSPEKTVLIPDMRAGCSLAESITAEDIRLLKQKYPGVPVVTYVNTSAEVKAETDVCCTSGNAKHIVESLNSDTVIFLPDEFLAQNIANQTNVKIISWKGRCEVHERFTAKEILAYKEQHKGIVVLAHPECPPEVVAVSDFTGSTAGMNNYVKDNQPKKVIMVTECSMSDNVAIENPNVDFIRPCNLCPHMKRITLKKIYDAIRFNQHEVIVDPNIIDKARLSIDRMLEIGRQN
jgi:quinolinate synthase|tara:strand:+ start:1650 stop:2669 length:1020 start_codon:yes stop_codon:yes gene_type:complete